MYSLDQEVKPENVRYFGRESRLFAEPVRRGVRPGRGCGRRSVNSAKSRRPHDSAMISGFGMPDPRPALGPVSEALTHGIRVEVLSRQSLEHSRALAGEWVFEYTVRITNEGMETVQLLSRHWIITDALDETREVKGPGVVGQQPVLEPGQSFRYSSWCPLTTPTGTMRGTYQMVRQDGSQFDIEIAPFALRAPYPVN